jgi:hypothetical protein
MYTDDEQYTIFKQGEPSLLSVILLVTIFNPIIWVLLMLSLLFILNL